MKITLTAVIVLAHLAGIVCVGVPAFAAEEGALPLPGAAGDERPYLMPPSERRRIKRRIDEQDGARQQYEQLRKKAAGGNGPAAAFLYAIERDAEMIPAATKWLLAGYGPDAYWVKKYRKRLADPE